MPRPAFEAAQEEKDTKISDTTECTDYSTKGEKQICGHPHACKKDVPDDQVCSTVDKIRKTISGDLLTVLTKENTDGGKALKKNHLGSSSR